VSGADRPRVVVHTAVSLDGATVGFPVDVGRFYALAGTWHEDVTLAGADTVLAQEEALAAAPQPGPEADAPLLAVVDGRRRVTGWRALRDAGYWSGVLAFRAGNPGPAGDLPVEEFVAGDGRVDLAAALAELGRRGAQVVRVDSGGGLTGALLAAGLVDEISLLVHPVLAGTDHRWHGTAQLPRTRLALRDSQRLDGDDGVVWLRYDVPH
jgi:2,5-diamino-6-(ribosylamino)-4(3H)-pyrimidinone 5'-phosphate reductase